ncbi:efflux RND transporter periplasmic adaptor subunit [Methylomonas sp. LL1]|uniref:efflux RND transporter periplasmic adaptor subunit n=1 Tax=Methylomonas sp. LL1 TaxID=2785785 RepID=UPI0018C36A7D|nr:efflux RND transporter periplasmic adaptor subunit [Methylomonas sp. LL1]QPK61724.1 efflux RND transporter periplasmic adaptor subunit [Methylomonas sp. LL1]
MTHYKLAATAFLILAGTAGTTLYLRNGKSEASTLTLYGNIDIRQVELSFHDPEHIAQILVKEGERVSQGQLLAVQALERFGYARDQAAARLEVQQHVLDKLLHGSRPQEIGKAGSDVKGAQAAVTLAQKELGRLQHLAERKLTSAESVDKAKAQYDGARENLQALKEQYALTSIGPRREDIQAAQAQLKADQAALQLANQSWQDAHLHAPRDGIIQNRILEPGDMANAQTPVLTLALTDPVWVRTYVPETELGKLRQGMPAVINSDSFPGKTYHGWVGYLSPTAEFTPKSVETSELRTSLVYQARIYACNADEQLRLGMPVTVRIDTLQAPSNPPACPGVS